MEKDFFGDLKKEVFEIQDRQPHLTPDNAFVAWFMRAFITEDEKNAVASITGKAGDKSADAIYIDHDNRLVFVVQGKFHQKNEPVASRSDVISLVDLGKNICSERKETFNSLLNNANATVTESFTQARKAILNKGYNLVLRFVTTGKVSATHIEEAENRIDNSEQIRFETFTRTDLMKLMQDYIEGAAPPVPTITLPVNTGEVFKRADQKTGITSWIFTMDGKDVGSIFNEIGIRLFARNIRGYLGNNKGVNRMIKNTIETEPQNFWYYNNGITIVCDDAKKIEKGRSNILRVTNAQIINGQQTTRTLALLENNEAEVLVKLIVIPRITDQSKNQFRHLVSEIVSATNWQNAISQSDLKSNDAEQVRIEREFKKLNYFYIRKKISKSEAAKYGADKYSFKISKEELARAVAAVTIDPYEIRMGKDRLFDDDLYGKIFDGRKAAEYINIYWLYRSVSYWAKTSDKYTYAKWLALNFIWNQLSSELRKITNRDAFKEISERPFKYDKEFTPLNRYIQGVFRLLAAFYNEGKRRDGKMQESINFFKHTNLHKEFQQFYSRQSSAKRNRLTKLSGRFIQNLQKFNE